MTLNEKIKYVISSPIEHKGWMCVFFIGSFLAWIALRITSMQRISALMGHHMQNREVSMLASKEQVQTAIKMGHRMSMVANNTPWECQCLPQALCIKWLLNRYKIPSVFYLGAAITPDAEQKMKAHAWVNVGKRTVIGGPQHKEYKVVASFTTPRLES